MDADLIRICDAWHDREITLEELHEQLKERRARRNEEQREGKGKEAQPSP